MKRYSKKNRNSKNRIIKDVINQNEMINYSKIEKKSNYFNWLLFYVVCISFLIFVFNLNDDNNFYKLLKVYMNDGLEDVSIEKIYSDIGTYQIKQNNLMEYLQKLEDKMMFVDKNDVMFLKINIASVREEVANNNDKKIYLDEFDKKTNEIIKQAMIIVNTEKENLNFNKSIDDYLKFFNKQFINRG